MTRAIRPVASIEDQQPPTFDGRSTIATATSLPPDGLGDCPEPSDCRSQMRLGGRSARVLLLPKAQGMGTRTKQGLGSNRNFQLGQTFVSSWDWRRA